MSIKTAVVRSILYLSLILFTFSGVAQNQLNTEEIAINPLINGTLITPPEADAPLAIIIGGSGPTDRNGNQQMVKNDALKKLAEGLSTQGIATFRYDKRLVAMLRKGDIDEVTIKFDDFVVDLVAVIDYFKEADYSAITLIGHSQGALVATLAAQQTSVSKIVSLEGAGHTIDTIILEQLAAQMPFLTEEATQAFEKLKNNKKIDSVSPPLSTLLRPSLQPFMRSWMVYDPAEELQRLQIPALIITGSKDLQVSEEEGNILAKAVPTAERVHIEKMNHVLREIEGNALENSKSYYQPSLPIVPQVVNAISDFINQ